MESCGPENYLCRPKLRFSVPYLLIVAAVIVFLLWAGIRVRRKNKQTARESELGTTKQGLADVSSAQELAATRPFAAPLGKQTDGDTIAAALSPGSAAKTSPHLSPGPNVSQGANKSSFPQAAGSFSPATQAADLSSPAAQAAPAGHGSFSPAVPRLRAAITGSHQIVGNSQQVAAAAATANATGLRPAEPGSIAKTHTAQHRLDQVSAVAGHSLARHNQSASSDEVSALNAAVAARDILQNPAASGQSSLTPELPEIGTGTSPMSCPIPVVPLAPAPKATMERLSSRPGGSSSRLSVPNVRRTPQVAQPVASPQPLLDVPIAKPPVPAVVPAPAPSLQPLGGFDVWEEPTDATAPHAVPNFDSAADENSSHFVVAESTVGGDASSANFESSQPSPVVATEAAAPKSAVPDEHPTSIAESSLSAGSTATAAAPSAGSLAEGVLSEGALSEGALPEGGISAAKPSSGRRVLPADQTGDMPMAAMGLQAPTAATPRRDALRREAAERRAEAEAEAENESSVAAAPLAMSAAEAIPGAVAPVISPPQVPGAGSEAKTSASSHQPPAPIAPKPVMSAGSISAQPVSAQPMPTQRNSDQLESALSGSTPSESAQSGSAQSGSAQSGTKSTETMSLPITPSQAAPEQSTLGKALPEQSSAFASPEPRDGEAASGSVAAGGSSPDTAGRAFAAPMTQSLPRTVQSTQMTQSNLGGQLDPLQPAKPEKQPQPAAESNPVPQSNPVEQSKLEKQSNPEKQSTPVQRPQQAAMAAPVVVTVPTGTSAEGAGAKVKDAVRVGESGAAMPAPGAEDRVEIDLTSVDPQVEPATKTAPTP